MPVRGYPKWRFAKPWFSGTGLLGGGRPPQGRTCGPHLPSTGLTDQREGRRVIVAICEDINSPTALTVPSEFFTKPGLPLSPLRLYTLASTTSPATSLTTPHVSPVTAPI